MKAMSKSELADEAGVTVTTLMNWCEPHMKELKAMGMRPNQRLLSPRIVKFLVDTFSIDID
jgi:hypothetical protein